MLRIWTFAVLLWVLPLFGSERSFDVIVYGGTAGGAMAAIAAAQHGLNVALLEPGSHVGGMVSGGLSNSDVDRQDVLVGGLTRQFFEAVGRHYGKPVAWAFEPHVAEQTFAEMLSAAHVQTFFGARLAKLVKSGSRIQSLSTEKDDSFSVGLRGRPDESGRRFLCGRARGSREVQRVPGRPAGPATW